MRYLLAVLLVLLVAPSGSGEPIAPSPEAAEFLAGAGTPLDYLVGRLKEHRIVLLGEAHWIRHDAGKLARCLPARGAFDCAVASFGRAVGFDIPNSPFGAARLEGFEYALGYPDLRLMDVADGYIWQEPLSQYRGVSLIPLAQFAPDAASLAEVSRHSPFADKLGSSPYEPEKQWRDQAQCKSCAVLQGEGFSRAVPLQKFRNPAGRAHRFLVADMTNRRKTSSHTN